MTVQLVNSDWNYILQLVYRINRCETYDEYTKTALHHLRTLVPFEKGIIFQAVSTSGVVRMAEPRAFNVNGRAFDEEKYIRGNYSAKWADYMYLPWSSVFRYTDLFAKEEDWTQTPIYRNILAPQKLHHGLYTTLIEHDMPVGAIVLWRGK